VTARWAAPPEPGSLGTRHAIVRELNHRLQLAKQDAALEPVAGPRRISVRRAKPLEIRERHRRATLGQQALSAEFAFEKDHV